MKQLFAFLIAAPILALAAIPAAHAQTASCATPGADNAFLGIQTIRLWPGKAPEAKGAACDDIPALTIFESRQGSETGSAVIILPGGAYVQLAGDLEGREIADWFTARGFRAFILSYRLASNGYFLPVPLLDARRAIQTVRARALDYHINPNRIVVIGFSAGGHLAALTGTQFVPGKPDAEDPIPGSAPSPVTPRTSAIAKSST
jgi:acetyl esterase/lipase